MKYFVRRAAVLTVLAALVTAIGRKPAVSVSEKGNKDTKPPAEVTELKADAIAGGILLTWKKPIDEKLSLLQQCLKKLVGQARLAQGRGLSPWAFSYTLISCANADKKRLNVISLAFFPVACCRASFALRTLIANCF